MRIGFDGRWHGNSGVGNYISGLLRAMDGLEEDFEMIVYENPSNPLCSFPGRHIRKVPVESPRYSFREQVELTRRCRADQLEIFHSPFYVAPWLAPCPVVVTIHDLIPFLFKIYPAPKEKLVQLGYRLAVKKAARLIADSQRTAADLQQVLNVPSHKITVIHLATSKEYFHPAKELGEKEYLATRYGVREPYILTFSSRDRRTKNLSAVLEALTICRQESQCKFQVVVVGSPEEFQEAVQRNGVKIDSVALPGFVPTPDLAKLYRNAQVFVIGSKYEGFGLPLLEAMSCGCAVVSSNGGSLPEVAGVDAVQVDPDDAQRMGRAVALLLSNPDECQRQQARSIRRAADFSWERTAKQTVSVYADVLTTRRRYAEPTRDVVQNPDARAGF